MEDAEHDSHEGGRNIIELGVDGLDEPRQAGASTATGSPSPLRSEASERRKMPLFEDVLGDLREQLNRMSGLVDLLAEQHQHEQLLARRSRSRTISSFKTERSTFATQAALKKQHQESNFPNEVLAPDPEEEGELRELKKTIQDGNSTALEHMLQEGLDPNKRLGETTCLDLNITSCTPLVLALMHQQSGLVTMLLQAEADPEAEYSFLAGAEQLVWSGPAIHACVPTGNLALLRELHRFRASLHASSSNGANLVWQAAYFGQNKVLEFLLLRGIDMEVKAQSQDNVSIHLSPLHAAARMGNVAAVTTLLDANASYNADDGCGNTPLDDAVSNGHADVVELLLARRADIFRVVPGGASEGGTRCIDKAFESNNHFLVAAVARGMRRAPDVPKDFRKADFMKFLLTPGDAAVEIWGVIFRPCPLKQYEQRVEAMRLRRVVTRAAYLNREVGMNVVYGPHSKVLQQLFQQKQPWPEGFEKFRDGLVREGEHGKHDIFLPVNFFACRLPWIAEDLQVILAILDCQHEEVYGVPACRAIVELKWRHERKGAHIRMVLAFVEIANLVLVNAILNEGTFLNDVPKFREYYLNVAVALALAVWVVVMVIEVAQVLGYVMNGLAKRYWMNTRHSFDMFVLVLTGIVIGWTWKSNLETANSPTYRISLGFIVALKWARLLISLRQLKSVGLSILPILSTIGDVVPFMGVLSVYIMGAVNMLYALGMHSLEDAFLIIYRLVVLGDMSLNELEGKSAVNYFLNGDGLLVEYNTPRTEYREVVRIIMVFVSFMLGISMMNLFVGILSLSYGEATARAPLAFVRSRVGIILDQCAAHTGFRRLLCRRRQQRKSLYSQPSLGSFSCEQSQPGSTSSSLWKRISSQTPTSMEDPQSYIWFCVARQEQ